MEYQHSSFPEAMQFQTYMDDATMDSTGSVLIDPDLKASMSPTMGSSCDPPQMQRFLADSCNSTYFGQQIDAKIQDTLTTAPNGVAPIPAALPHRQESPSYTHPSSSCSSARSPFMDTDYYNIHSPPTPTDPPSWSTVPGYYDRWGSHNQLYQHTGLAENCVKPIEVNPYPTSFYEDITARPGLLVRDLSMSSDDSSALEEQWNSERNQLPRHMSPETLSPVKEEICIPGLDPVYSLINAVKEVPSAEEVDAPIKVEDEDDCRPNRRQKRTSPHGNRASKARKRASGSQSATHAKRVKTELIDPVNDNIATAKPSLKGSKRSFPCKECPDIIFKDENGLQKHIKTQHTRPFICVFHFAGCKSTFASKNEWKRHCASQHLLLNYWLCQQDLCAKVSNASQPSNKAASSCQDASHGGGGCGPALPNGAIFNRKDLYTQHLRRMHVPPNVKKQVKQKKPVPEWEDSVRSYQDQAHRTRCNLPTRMGCPSPGCTTEFEGPNAWDERMEHVAKHLDKAGLGVESPLVFGGESDRSLVEWAARPDVSIIRSDDQGRWELHNPLRPTGHPRKGMHHTEEDEDAEGEDFEE